jgi:hypothetical protein
MSVQTHDELEAHLAELFDRQARAFPDTTREWSDIPVASVAAIDERRKQRRARTPFGVVTGIAAAIMLVVGVMNFGQSGGRIRVKPPVQGQPLGGPVTWDSEHNLVQFKADDFVITASGKQFSAQGAQVDVHSDAGNPDYWTQEMTWQEHGVEMRLYIYFASDGRDWWASEIRTYNGRADGDWIEYHGTYFKTPLGEPFTGALDLTDPATGSSLHVKGLRLQVHPKKLDCSVGTGRFAIASSFERPAIELGRGAGEMGTEMWLVDRTSCANVSAQERYTFTWSSADPDIATVVPYRPCTGIGGTQPAACERGGLPVFRAHKPGRTTFHAVAKDTTGAVVGERDFAVVVKG